MDSFFFCSNCVYEFGYTLIMLLTCYWEKQNLFMGNYVESVDFLVPRVTCSLRLGIFEQAYTGSHGYQASVYWMISFGKKITNNANVIYTDYSVGQ